MVKNFRVSLYCFSLVLCKGSFGFWRRLKDKLLPEYHCAQYFKKPLDTLFPPVSLSCAPNVSERSPTMIVSPLPNYDDLEAIRLALPLFRAVLPNCCVLIIFKLYCYGSSNTSHEAEIGHYVLAINTRIGLFI